MQSLELGIASRQRVVTIECQEVDHIHKCLLCKASEKLRGWLRKASDGRSSQRTKQEIALCNDHCHYVVDRRDQSYRCCRIDDDRTTAAPPTER